MKLKCLGCMRWIIIGTICTVVVALTYTIVLLVNQERQLDEVGVAIHRISRNVGILEIERLKARVIELEQEEMEANTTELFKDCEEQN